MVKVLPSSVKEWQQIVEAHWRRKEILESGVHSIAIRAEAESVSISGSKMESSDFLALRVIWKEHLGKSLFQQKFFKFKLDKDDEKTVAEDAADLLDGLKAWREYKKHITSKNFKEEFLTPGHAFKLVDAAFRSVEGLPKYPEGEHGEGSSPVHLRRAERTLRSDTKGTAMPSSGSPLPIRSKLSFGGPDESPSKGSHTSQPAGHSRMTSIDRFWADFRDHPEEKKNSSSSGKTTTAMGDDDTPMSQQQTQQTPDEQVVNLALINYMNALTLGVHGIDTMWCIDRMEFAIEDVLAARTDGFLHCGGRVRRPGAIVECKARVREVCKPAVNYQEAAEMSAWIYRRDFGDFVNRVSQKDGKRRRVMISMNHSEIYIIIAEFEEAYCHYLRQTSVPLTSGKPIPINKDSFMTMNSYGPFNTTDSKHIRHLTRWLEGFSLAQSSLCTNVEDKHQKGEHTADGTGSGDEGYMDDQSEAEDD